MTTWSCQASKTKQSNYARESKIRPICEGGFSPTVAMLHADFCVDTSWKAEVLQAVDGLWRSVRDVDEALMHTHLVRLAAHLVDVWAFDDRVGAAASG